jgi:nitrous-oxide reductase
MRRAILLIGVVIFLALTIVSCSSRGTREGTPSVESLMKARGLNEADVVAALKTYTPTGKADEFYMFASGGHSGQVIVIGVPSMRILKYIAVFTPEPWQGYGYDEETMKVLADGSPKGKLLTWGDVHHPALSQTNGDYDGEFLFVNDKANARVAVISLKDFNTTQIVRSDLIESDHGASFVTPNTDYVFESSQYATPLGGGYAELKNYETQYRGLAIFWKFDRQKGRIDETKSFAMELPPYFQDLASAGRLGSDGWLFLNSFNTEEATGGTMEGKPAVESGASQNDMDYLHVINWKKAEQVASAGKTTTIKNMRVIPMQTAIDEGLLYFVPEPKSPHGVDVTPDGKDISVSGKLDTHETVYSFDKIKGLIDAKNFSGKDRYGVPILPFQQAIRGQVEMGLGPLHTQYDGKGNAYTTLFLESKVAKWSLQDLKVIDKIPVHYNVGHLAIPGGDTAHPDGKYLIAMNKWALDRFAPVGPLLPQNFQLIDIASQKMQLLYDMPIGLGEPHYAEMIRADKIKPWDFYKPAGMNPVTHEKDAFAIVNEKEARIERKADGVHVYMTAIRSHFTPDHITVKQGDKVHIHVTSLEQTKDATHGFAIAAYNVNLSLEPGKTNNASFVADRSGTYPFYCTEFCSALHLEMMGYLLVEPSGKAAANDAAKDKPYQQALAKKP